MAKVEVEKYHVALLGVDLNDLAVLSHVGLLVLPSDVVESLRERVDFSLRSHGGNGSVREFALSRETNGAAMTRMVRGSAIIEQIRFVYRVF